MNKKIILLISLILLAIAGAFAYQKYGKYLPSEPTTTPIHSLTSAEMAKIRQNTPITEVKVYKSERIVKLLHR